jgi:hypothetical protein
MFGLFVMSHIRIAMDLCYYISIVPLSIIILLSKIEEVRLQQELIPGVSHVNLYLYLNNNKEAKFQAFCFVHPFVWSISL